MSNTTMPIELPAQEKPAVFTAQRLVRFSDCDPAGMVFYPQYFVMLNGLIEDWFSQALRVDYATLLGPRSIGLPMASLQCDFKNPSRMGESITFHLRLLRQGNRSLTLSLKCNGTLAPQTLRWSAEFVIVTTSLASGLSISIPQDIVQGIARWRTLSEEST
jgi:4-hydroxybenzoyl-CoA thioesterase